MSNKTYDVIVVGSGAAGLIAAIKAARDGKNTLLLEKLSNIGPKLKATGGGRCNLSNTLDNTDFMKSFGKNGKFMRDALNKLDHIKLMDFLKSINVETHIPDGFRIFPVTHNSTTIINALKNELKRLNVKILFNTTAKQLIVENNKIIGIETNNSILSTKAIILATGGLGYPQLGSTGDGYNMVEKVGHSITKLYPAMMPLNTKETWVSNCTSHTIPKVKMKVNINNKLIKKLSATGDLIFTKKGIRGPVVLDFAREITPHLDQFDEVPILVNLTKGMDENDIINHIKNKTKSLHSNKIVDTLDSILPYTVLNEICSSIKVNIKEEYKNLKGIKKNKLLETLAWTPLTIIGHDGFDKAMITRGGINLKEINPSSMESKNISNLYFAGEIVDLDGPCGGYNLQWAFSSGYLAAHLK